MDPKDYLIIAMGDELLRMTSQLSRVAEKKMPPEDASPICQEPGLGNYNRPPAVLDIVPPTTFHQAINILLQTIGEDPTRSGLVETPERVRKAWEEMFSGYRTNIKELFKVFEEPNADEMVVVKNIPFTSFCEHHLLPFDGVAHVGYIPSSQIIGLSKIARVVDAYAKRLQVQERFTTQITDAFVKYLPSSRGSACIVEAEHFCMGCRGVKKSGAATVTSSVTGVFRTQSEVRAEFFACVRGG